MGCTIVAVERQLTAVVKAKVPFPEIANAQRSARAAVGAALPSLDAGPLGRPVTRFRTPAHDALDMEIGTIVGRAFAAKGEVVPSELPAGRAAHFQLKGPFDGMPGAWQTLFDWCKAENLDLAGINWEIYMPWEGVDSGLFEVLRRQTVRGVSAVSDFRQTDRFVTGSGVLQVRHRRGIGPRAGKPVLDPFARAPGRLNRTKTFITLSGPAARNVVAAPFSGLVPFKHAAGET
jgi:hypothetical protein